MWTTKSHDRNFSLSIIRMLTSASMSLSFCSFSWTFISNTSSISRSIFFIFCSCSLFSISNWARGSLCVACQDRAFKRNYLYHTHTHSIIINLNYIITQNENNPTLRGHWISWGQESWPHPLVYDSGSSHSGPVQSSLSDPACVSWGCGVGVVRGCGVVTCIIMKCWYCMYTQCSIDFNKFACSAVPSNRVTCTVHSL